MARIRHIALTTQNPSEVAAFYKEALGLQQVRQHESGAIFLTDGYINLAILNWKTEKDADVGARGSNFSGIHHFGVEVEDLDAACSDLESAGAERLSQKPNIEQKAAAPRNYEMKWQGPDGVVFDISHTGWQVGP